jgi:hypothetical protein
MLPGGSSSVPFNMAVHCFLFVLSALISSDPRRAPDPNWDIAEQRSGSHEGVTLIRRHPPARNP